MDVLHVYLCACVRARECVYSLWVEIFKKRIGNPKTPTDYVFLSCQIRFWSEFTFSTCLNVKELLAWKQCDTCNLFDCNRSWNPNYEVLKEKIDYLAGLGGLIKWLSVDFVSSRFVAVIKIPMLNAEMWVKFKFQKNNFNKVRVRNILSSQHRTYNLKVKSTFHDLLAM